jgi:hypothetical protein
MVLDLPAQKNERETAPEDPSWANAGWRARPDGCAVHSTTTTVPAWEPTAAALAGASREWATRGGAAIRRNAVQGKLQCKGNAPAPTGVGNSVAGNKEDQCRRFWPNSAPRANDDGDGITGPSPMLVSDFPYREAWDYPANNASGSSAYPVNQPSSTLDL